MPVLPRGLNFDHMAAVRAVSPLKNSLGTSRSSVLLSVLSAIYLPIRSPLSFHFPLCCSPWRPLTMGCDGRDCPWARRLPVPQHCTAGLPPPPLQSSFISRPAAELNSGSRTHGDAFCYRLSLRASQRPLLSAGIRGEHLHTCSTFRSSPSAFCTKRFGTTLHFLFLFPIFGEKRERNTEHEFEAGFNESPEPITIVFLEYTSGFPQHTASSVTQFNTQLG